MARVTVVTDGIERPEASGSLRPLSRRLSCKAMAAAGARIVIASVRDDFTPAGWQRLGHTPNWMRWLTPTADLRSASWLWTANDSMQALRNSRTGTPCAAVGTVFVVPSDRFAGSRDFRLRPAVIRLSGGPQNQAERGCPDVVKVDRSAAEIILRGMSVTER